MAPLSRAETTDLVRALASPGVPDSLLATLGEEAWRASDGNAFVVVEVMHALREGAPVPGPRVYPSRTGSELSSGGGLTGSPAEAADWSLPRP